MTEISAEERAVAIDVLDSEYRLLTGALSAAWSASLVRTSVFLGVLSAAGVALGFVAQRGIGESEFVTLALVVLPNVLLLGLATFVRIVQVQREIIVYITGMNRIRHFFQEVAPHTRPYFILPAYDDEHAIFRSQGTGMNRRAPRHRVLYLAVQTQGIVGIVVAVVAAAFAALVVRPLGPLGPWFASPIAFVATLALLFVYWQRSLEELNSSIRPVFPTPPEEVDAPF